MANYSQCSRMMECDQLSGISQLSQFEWQLASQCLSYVKCQDCVSMDNGYCKIQLWGQSWSEDIPYVDIRPHPWRSLKTKGSQRQVPLVGASLWAAQRIKANASSCFAFPRYTDSERCNANSASMLLEDGQQQASAMLLAMAIPWRCWLSGWRRLRPSRSNDFNLRP
jgi:hypothetical protein